MASKRPIAELEEKPNCESKKSKDRADECCSFVARIGFHRSSSISECARGSAAFECVGVERVQTCPELFETSGSLDRNAVSENSPNLSEGEVQVASNCRQWTKLADSLADSSQDASTVASSDEDRPGGNGHLDSLQQVVENGRFPVEGKRGWQRLEACRQQFAGSVTIPDAWEGDCYLKDWVEWTSVERALHPEGLLVAQAALIVESSRGPFA
eukprot:TRINITY_DN5813_c0_g1_i2.p1 TRINITY_DN5813_c0_g1~~TRINITY_DN5813_c0_g1_i2.p1  ORF type:complete len:239 (+),score=22.34 TRINITY_DN5813_c0_g1_i2:80-718(+)